MEQNDHFYALEGLFDTRPMVNLDRPLGTFGNWILDKHVSTEKKMKESNLFTTQKP